MAKSQVQQPSQPQDSESAAKARAAQRAQEERESQVQRRAEHIQRRADTIFQAHEIACAKVDEAIAAINTALQSLVAVDKSISTLGLNHELHLSRRLKLTIPIKDMATASLRLSAATKLLRGTAQQQRQAVKEYLSKPESVFE